MRVIAGSARGRRLTAPPGHGTRPTSDRAREALYSALAARVPGAVVLDLYAGSGALAIEALSRGADRAVLVERDRRATAVIARNLATAGVAERARVHAVEVARFCGQPTGGPFDLVLADPPYAIPLATVHAELSALRDAGALAPGAVVVVERDRRDAALGDAKVPGFLRHERDRAYGDTVLRTYHHEDESA